MNLWELEFRPAPKTITYLRAFTAAGAACLLAGAFLSPQRAWAGLLMASFALTALGLGATFFVALQYASGASWAVALRRIPEAMSAVLPFGAAGLLAVLLFRPSIYAWTSHSAHGLTGFKALWLDRPFFLARAVVYLALWLLFTYWLAGHSRRQDADGDLEHTRRNIRLSVIFLPVFALTFWLASVDWIMSLEPEWYSTIFGVYNFAGMFSAALAAIILLAIWLRRSGPLRDFINLEHLHDLGKLQFAFCTFWMYIWFSQYMLIWYANITEESVYYVLRLRGYWTPLFLLNMVLNWAVPFLALLPKFTKRTPSRLGKVAVFVLVGRCLDLYLMILPPVTGGAMTLPLLEIGILAGAAGLFLLVFLRALRQAPQVPVQDPYLAESLHYHN